MRSDDGTWVWPLTAEARFLTPFRLEEVDQVTRILGLNSRKEP